jgi:hypothetical protein
VRQKIENGCASFSRSSPGGSMSIVQRVKDILLNPKGTWPLIDAEAATVQSVYVPYVLVLAAIPVIAGFIGYSLLGVGGMGFSYRVPVVSWAWWSAMRSRS